MNYIKLSICFLLSLLYVHTCFANWCDGKKIIFFKMTLSERVVRGKTEIINEINSIEKISMELRYNIKRNIDGLTEELEENNQKIIKETTALCSLSKKNRYAPIDFNGIHLRDKDEIMAQIRLNIASIQTNQVVIKYILEKKKEYLTLNKQLLFKSNELAVLEKKFNALKDPRRSKIQTNNIDIALQNACVSIGQSENLRMKYTPKTRDELFFMASKNNQVQTITTEQTSRFMKTCNFTSLAGRGIIKDKPWWKIWN